MVFGPYKEAQGSCPLCKKIIGNGDCGVLLSFKTVEDEPDLAEAIHVHENCAIGLRDFFEHIDVLDECLAPYVKKWFEKLKEKR